MRRIALFLSVLSLCAACATEPTSEDVTPTVTTPPTAPPTTTTTLPATTTTSLPPGPPVAWKAPNGVPLAVISETPSGVEALSTCGDPMTLHDGTPIHDVDVVLDAGHGGPIDTGALGANGLPEKEINLKVALATAELLEARGIATLLTRIGDYPLPIPVRTEYAELAGATAVVSIHHYPPEAPASDLPGVEIFVQQSSAESQRLGGLIYDSTMAALGDFDVDWDRAPDAGVLTVTNSRGTDAYGMVRRPSMPSVLVELGYIANDAEAELYRRPEYVPAAAGALADGIEAFFSSDREGAPLGDGRNFDPQPGVGVDQCIDVELDDALYPDVLGVEISGDDGAFDFAVTISSSYDSPERHADGFRVLGDDGVIYVTQSLTRDPVAEQPFTSFAADVEIDEMVSHVVIEARDSVYGWGGATVTVDLP